MNKTNIETFKKIISCGGECYIDISINCRHCYLIEFNIGCPPVSEKRVEIAKQKLKELQGDNMKNEVPSLKDLIQNVRDFADELENKCDVFEKLNEKKEVPFRVGGVYEVNNNSKIIFFLISRLYGIPEYQLVNCKHGMLCHQGTGSQWVDRKEIESSIAKCSYLGQLFDILYSTY